MFGTILMLIIMIPVALLMVGIGIYQIKSPKPAGFYSGVEPPKPEEINDLRAWNTKHGAMWMVYGGIIALSAIIFSFVIDGLVGTVILIGGVMLPLPFMVWWHHHLESKYLKK